jgi:hypothetical protein
MYFGLFGNKADIEEQFSCSFEGALLFAWYDYVDYSGEAFVLYEEGQWRPETVLLAELQARPAFFGEESSYGPRMPPEALAYLRSTLTEITSAAN